jgi:nucleotide-binding universal stress UspA family protein
VLRLPGEAELAARRAEVEALLRAVMPRGLTADVLQSAGFAQVEILKAARVLEPDLLVLPAQRPESRCADELAAPPSDALRLAASGAPCPVLAAVGEDRYGGPFERVLAAVDLSGDDAAGARALLDCAARLAAREGAELTVLHVLPLQPGEAAPGQQEMTRQVEAAQSRLAYLCTGLPGAGRFARVVSEGAPAVEILKHARERRADLLVLAPHAGADETGVCARVLRGARVPVLLAGPGALPVPSPLPRPKG